MKSNKLKFASMKSLATLFLIGTALSFSACNKKTEPNPKPEPAPTPITVPATFTQKCVSEKFTGEWCGNCPAAGAFYESMTNTYHINNKFIGVAIHAGSPGSDQFMDKPADVAMYQYLYQYLSSPTQSSTIGFPNVMIMRSKNPVNGLIVNGFSSSEWSNRVGQEIAKKSSCGLCLVTKINGSTLSTTVNYAFSSALPAGSYAITAYLLENNLDGSKQVSAPAGYMQMHVLRELLTPKEGTSISDVSTLNKLMELKLSDINIASYNAANLEVVAFIHKKGATYDDRIIINGQKVKAGSTQLFD